MQVVTTVGLDIAKSVFQVHGVDAAGQVVIRRQLKRRYVLAFFEKLPACLVGIEACASSHHWSRELKTLGHTVRLMPPAYVKPYVKRQKNDTADAEAICEAVTRANMRFVATKTPVQQSCLTLHRTRHLFIRQQTAVINVIRAHLAEFGIVAPVGRKGIETLLDVVANPTDKRVPVIARACLAALGAQLRRLKEQILEFDRMIMAWHRSNEASKRLDAIPGVGPVLATALVASIADPKAFRSGRNFSAWIGLVPKQHSSGGKDRLGNISKQGDRYLRSLFMAGALAVIRYAKIHGTTHRPWLTALLARRPTKIAAIALANKTLFADLNDPWCACCARQSRWQTRSTKSLARQLTRTAPSECGGGCTRQQECAHRLGHARQRQILRTQTIGTSGLGRSGKRTHK
jgi:transposase